MPSRLPSAWFSNVRGDILSGLVVALALIPEAIAFSIIAGVDPKVGLYASFLIAMITAFVGGRPAMISAATAAMALLMGTLVKNHGVEYLFAATVLTGVIQVILGFMKVGSVMRFVSKSVMTGFVNALAILIFLAQLPELNLWKADVTWIAWALTAGGLAIIYILPRFTKIIPSPLICIIVLSLIAYFTNMDVRRVGDLGALPSSLPAFLLPKVPFSFETFQIILPYAISLAIVGLLESLLTAQIVDQLTDTSSDKNREARGQGIANFITGFFGGMAGCAMIGQSVINVKSGGRTRLSTFVAGVVLIILCVVLGPWVSKIPMPALVAIMIMVSIGTFNWGSFKNLAVHPKSTSLVMLATVAVTIWQHNLAIGVGVGVLLSALFFAKKVSQIFEVTSTLSGDTRTYTLRGQIFFASSEKFIAAFDFKEVLAKVVIDVSHAHFWDLTSVGALDTVVLKYRREGTEVEILGMNEASATIVDKLGEHDKPGAIDRMLEH
ncbi:MAG: SulP family inorganic anion transporter [Akkermansiaceae bacterium]|jgi:sulfate permease, SulP family|nr:SulP family inorganic anion transporter [Akkermansiaceae bacterium]MDP4646112.1 SulP family inorganic anion transporter [Akkermansiaceae bacterium]MDP4720911.1 SulP family inorganic anion transporter [Akkermansiaceae bacterium]MDP4780730.1 SulP family inorganic anion transporter [Akkermansiaceae bacterium]MDP4845676.1 SulP family inorganic anion transporter [Akkermansiaceae bacterium]